MCNIKCPYLPCGSNENCIGCCYDPQERPMTKEMFWDANCHLGCGDCKYCNPSADMDSIESPCKRIDHKHIQFAVPWFKSYDCGQRSGGICSDFEPNEWELWLYRHWKSEFKDIEHGKGSSTIPRYVGLCLDKDQSIRYYVNADDFYNNTFKESDGSLKWVKKEYYKQSRKSPIGYVLVTEWKYPQFEKKVKTIETKR